MSITNRTSQGPFQIRAIFIRKSSCELTKGFNPLVPNQPLSGHFRMMPSEGYDYTATSETDPPKFVSVALTTQFEFIYKRLNTEDINPESIPDSDICAKITADISVDYAIVSEHQPTEADLQAWAEGPVLAHAWPYWREFCHSNLSRMGLPMSLMPLLNFATKPAAPEEPKS